MSEVEHGFDPFSYGEAPVMGRAVLELNVELQHRERERLHDAKGNLALLRNAFLLLTRDGDIKRFIESMEALERSLTRTVQSMAPEFEAE